MRPTCSLKLAKFCSRTVITLDMPAYSYSEGLSGSGPQPVIKLQIIRSHSQVKTLRLHQTMLSCIGCYSHINGTKQNYNDEPNEYLSYTIYQTFFFFFYTDKVVTLGSAYFSLRAEAQLTILSPRVQSQKRKKLTIYECQKMVRSR